MYKIIVGVQCLQRIQLQHVPCGGRQVSFIAKLLYRKEKKLATPAVP